MTGPPTDQTLHAEITRFGYIYQPLPGLDPVTQFSTDTLTFGGSKSATIVRINVTVTTTTTSGYSDLSQHPGFSVKPVWYCSNANNLRPLSYGLYIVSTPAGLVDSLLSIAANVSSNPAAVAVTLDVFPALIIIEQDVSINDVAQLAASQNSSVSLVVPLLLTSPPYPLLSGAPVPPSQTLDLSGCIGCVSLTGPARVYLTNLHLTGLHRPSPSPGPGPGPISNVDGRQLSLALWALQFNRSSGIPSVILYNVTLTLPQVPPPPTPYTPHPPPYTRATFH